MLEQHIILIGFKNVGKSTLGRALAAKLGMNFIDLDEMIEKIYYDSFQKALTCRQIMQLNGEKAFREYECAALGYSLGKNASVIALGGGACLDSNNQKILLSHKIIHVTAIPSLVYERIISQGIPAFFPATEHSKDYFTKLWRERELVYQYVANITVDNSCSIEQALVAIIKELKKCLVSA